MESADQIIILKRSEDHGLLYVRVERCFRCK